MLCRSGAGHCGSPPSEHAAGRRATVGPSPAQGRPGGSPRPPAPVAPPPRQGRRRDLPAREAGEDVPGTTGRRCCGPDHCARLDRVGRRRWFAGSRADDPVGAGRRPLQRPVRRFRIRSRRTRIRSGPTRTERTRIHADVFRPDVLRPAGSRHRGAGCSRPGIGRLRPAHRHREDHRRAAARRHPGDLR